MATDDNRTWLKPEQVDQMRNAAYSDTFASYLRSRNESIIALLYDAGLRPTELVASTTEMFHADTGVLRLPSSVQKDYPNDDSPPPATIELGQDRWTNDTVRTLSQYLEGRWKDSQFLFPSRKSEAISTRSLRELIENIAVEADVRPYKGFTERGDPSDVTPYTFRHSIAYRIIEARDDPGTLNDVKRRLRHRSITTTERHYEMFDTV